MTVKSKIEIRKKWGHNELYINGFTQSTLAYYWDWYRVFKKARVLHKSNQRVLLLGLGGGDVVKLLTKFLPDVAIVSVELEAEVVQVARDSFGVTESEALKIIVHDAQTYMRTNRALFDLVIVDLYSGDDIPDFVRSLNFLTHVARALSPSGRAIFNYASHGFREQDFVSYEKQLRNVFGSVEKKLVWGHTFYIASAKRILAIS